MSASERKLTSPLFLGVSLFGHLEWSSISIPGYRTVLCSRVWPGRSCTARKFLMRRQMSIGFVRRIVCVLYAVGPPMVRNGAEYANDGNRSTRAGIRLFGRVPQFDFHLEPLPTPSNRSCINSSKARTRAVTECRWLYAPSNCSGAGHRSSGTSRNRPASR